MTRHPHNPPAAFSHRVLLTLVLFLALSGSCAHASWQARADSLFSDADLRFEVGDYKKAATLYGATVDAIESNAEPIETSYFAKLAARSRFLMARSHERLEEWDAALQNYELSLTEMSEVEDLVRLRMAACHAGAGNLERGMDELRVVIDDGVDGNFDLRAILDLATYYDEAGNYDIALQWYRVYLAEAGGYNERALAHYRIGRAYDRRGDKEAAKRSYATAVADYPRSRHADDALTKGRNIERSFTDRYHQGLVLYNRKRYSEAAEFLTYYLRHDREKEFAHDASYFLGRSHQRLGNYRTAARSYEDAIESGPASEYHDLAWSKLAYSRRATGRLDKSLATYERFVELHPERDAAPDLLWEKARLLEEKRRLDEAGDEFRRIAGAYPDSPVAGDALFRAGLCLFKTEDYDAAAAHFASIVADSSGDEASRALFWSGKCSEMIKGADEAAAVYAEAVNVAPDSYYAARAQSRLRELGPTREPGSESGSASSRRRGAPSLGPWGVEGLEFAAWLAEWHDEVYLPAGRTALRRTISAMPAFRRADTLLALGMRTSALAELSALADDVGRDPRALELLVEYCERAGLHKRAILLAERILSLSPADGLSEVPVYLRKKVCPVHFRDIVEGECEVKGLDPSIEFSLIRQESLFEPEAVSWVGARGLSQIMPATGRWLARRLNHKGFRNAHLFDPATNVRFGTEYLAVQIDEFDGDVMRALAAYNGGPEASERWWRYGGGRDTDIFVEDIGYSQTADYVRRVFLYSEVYRDIYGLGLN